MAQTLGQIVEAARLTARNGNKRNDISLPGGWTVTTWYDRRTESYVSQLKDASNSQIGDAYYDGHSDHVPSSRESLVDRYSHIYTRGMV